MVRLAVALYGVILRLYPRDFRRRFGRRLLADFAEARRRARTGTGRSAVVRLAVRELVDLARNLPGAWLDVRRGTTTSAMEGSVRDAVHAARALARRPVFAGVAVLTLGVGIGAATTTYAVVDAVLLRPFGYPDAEDLVFLWESYREDESKSLSYPNYLDWRDRNTVFEDLGAQADWSFTLTGEGPATELATQLVSADLLDALGIAPASGRWISEEDERLEARVVVVSDALWRDRFAADPAVLGETVTLSGLPYTVVGVMPPGLEVPLRGADAWAPLTTLSAEERANRSSHPGIVAFGRLRDGVSLDQAREDLGRVTARLAEEHPDANQYAGARLVSFRDRYLSGAERLLWPLAGAVVLLLLLVCANVASLFLTRSAERGREAAIRTALGATRSRVARLLLTEALLVSVAGGLVGLAIAAGSLDAIEALRPAELPRLDALRLDARVFAFSLAVASMAGLASGLVPALHLSRGAPSDAMRDGDRRGSGRKVGALRRAMVVAEVAAATILLVGTGLMVRSVASLTSQEAGLDPDGVLVAGVPLPASAYPTDADRAATYRQLMERVRALPGVRSVAGIDPVPLGLGNRQFSLSGRGLPTVDEEGLRVDVYMTTPGYFETMRVPVLAGAGFTGHETWDDTRIVIDETLAERLWPGEPLDAILGRRVAFRGDDSPDLTVAGVAGHVRHYGLREPGREQLYLPYTATVWGLNLVVRVEGEPLSVVPGIRAALQDIDPLVPLSGVRPMNELARASVAEEAVALRALAALGAVAVGLALLGLYGVVAFHVVARTRELGIRLALGAGRARVVRGVLFRGLSLATLGVALGLVASLPAGRALEGLLFGVSGVDAPTLAAVAVTVVVMSLLATLLPVRRIVSIDPTRALRAE